MMTLSLINFKEELLDLLKATIGEDNLEVKTVTKTNGLKTGVHLKEKDGLITPIVYLDDFYDMHQSGKPMENILESIILTLNLEEEKDLSPENLMERFFDPKNIFFCVVNTEKNQEMLKDLPHREFLDLSFIYRSNLGEGIDKQRMTTLITYEKMELLGMTEEDLWENANANLGKLCFVSIADMFGGEEKTLFHAITSEDRLFGAVFGFLPDRMKNLADRLELDKFYILPSSIHEVIVLYVYDPELKDIVMEVNRSSAVRSDEFLSDNVYCYHDGQITIMD